MNRIFALVCSLIGHRWRRFRKAEQHPIYMKGYGTVAYSSQMRCCGRCGEVRYAKQRKPKGATA